jgi:hypothetical protein
MPPVIIDFSEDDSPQAEFSHMLEFVYLYKFETRWDVKDGKAWQLRGQILSDAADFYTDMAPETCQMISCDFEFMLLALPVSQGLE